MSSFTVLSLFPHLLQALSSQTGRYSSSPLGGRPISSLEVPLKSHGRGCAPPPPSASMDRREMLAASVLTATTSLSLQPSAVAATGAVQPPPDVSVCMPPTSDGKELPFLEKLDYCMGVAGQNVTPTPFHFPPGPTRVRRAAHKLSCHEVSDYNEAYKRMRELPDEDPRSMRRQAAIHAAFCNFVYETTQVPYNFLSIHANDLFLPWHRFYLYFHERILADLIRNPTFAIPYWNWDDQVECGNTMPPVFENEILLPSLYNVKRNQDHLPPEIIDLGYGDGATPTDIIEENTAIMHKGVVAASSPSVFMGGSFLLTKEPGSLESIHNAVHDWTGDPNYIRPNEDMGLLYSAARDPIFYAHHANVDRIWTVWETLPNVDTNDLYQNTDFRESSFVFFDESSNLVKVSVGDCLTSSSMLNISYEPATRGDEKWINYTPKASRQNLGESRDKKKKSIKALKGPISLLDTISTLVSPPPIRDRRSSQQQPILVLENVRIFMSNPVSFVVFINFPDANSRTRLDCAEFVGLYKNLPHLDMPHMKGPTNLLLKFPLGESLDILNLDVNSSLIVTVVARSPIDPIKYPVTIEGFSIHYE